MSEASGLLEFSREIAFDPGVLFDGDLLYLQADSRLMRVTPAGGVSSLATGTVKIAFDDAGSLLVIGAAPGGASWRVSRIVAAEIPSSGLLPAFLLSAILLWTSTRLLRSQAPSEAIRY
ncbi:MAG: hypothetical protein R3F35_21805 [Myxococcota bacterium]